MDKLIKLIRQREEFCHACLSVDRKLCPIGNYYDIYSRICESPCKTSFQLVLCWECIAILKKIKRFEEKVRESQIFFTSLHSNRQKITPNSLSNLHTYHSDPDKTINVSHKEKSENELKQNIKQEFESDNDDYVTNEYTESYKNDFLLDDIKTEVPKTEFKQDNCDVDNRKKTKKPKQYKYVVDKISKSDIERLTKTIPIALNEVRYWLKRERESSVFKNAMYKCETCVDSWKTEKGLLEHNKKYHDLTSGAFTCDICSCRFPSKRRLRAHVARHLRVRECGACRHRGCGARHMARHLAAHTRRLQCAACGCLSFSNMRQLYRHHRELHEVFECDHCAKRCRSRRTLEKHIRRHFETYECKACDKRYKTRATYRKHCVTRHAAPTEHAYCVQCDKQFPSAPLYRRHVASSSAHAAERDAHRTVSKVPCPCCGRVYSRNTYMMNHYRHVHMNQSNYYCQQCDRHFLNRTRYVDHVRYKHEGVQKEKNKLCNICGRGFAANRTLLNHIRTHSGERPFACAHCGGTFTQKHAMLAHERRAHMRPPAASAGGTGAA